MRVHHWLVGMFVFMALGEMQPNTQSHQNPGHKQLNGDGLSENQNRNDRTKKRSGRKIGAGARRAEMPERDNEQRKAYAVAKKTDAAGKQNIKRPG